MNYNRIPVNLSFHIEIIFKQIKNINTNVQYIHIPTTRTRKKWRKYLLKQHQGAKNIIIR